MAAERVGAVDALRGLALFGMLVVHFQYYADGPPAWGDRIQTVVDLVFLERFWALFAFLFGVGFGLQSERWGESSSGVRRYIRRLTVLAALALLISAGTGYRVLLTYAFWGFALLPMRRWSPRALATAALMISLAGPAVSAARWQVEKRTIGLERSNARVEEGIASWRNHLREEAEIKQRGTFPQLMAARLRFDMSGFARWTTYVPGPDLLMFVLGLLAARARVIREPRRHRRTLIAVLLYGAAGGQLLEQMSSAWLLQVSGGSLRVQQVWHGLLLVVASPMYQGLAYGAALLLWIADARVFPRFCVWLTYAGRMSLTTYIVQVCGLELAFSGGRSITRPAALLGAAVFFAVQVAFARWWFGRFRIGPAEWVWRSLTYGAAQPFRIQHPSSAVV